jgi:hypothetical protein
MRVAFISTAEGLSDLDRVIAFGCFFLAQLLTEQLFT